ncbi:hypothetical protein [Amycolatopsis sp. NBC_00438]|uniref:hypothetical protein n=1 Tax=Amycolatopsis sp. NBC_00438 TaxID=2903558 RepID=UPI002E20D1DB
MSDGEFGDGEFRVRIGNGGWLLIDAANLPGPLYLRLQDRNGRLCVAEFYLDAQEGAPITPQDLASIPVARIESAANAFWSDKIRDSIGRPAPDLSTLATYFDLGLGNAAPVARQIRYGNWVVQSLATQKYVPAGEVRTTLKIDDDLSVELATVDRRTTSQKWSQIRASDRQFRLTPDQGPTEGLTDEFLALIKRAYDAARARGERPNASIREQLGGDTRGISLKTVQRWVFTARQRGIMLPPSRKGAAS